MVCDDQDDFSLERAIYLAYAKYEFGFIYTSEGIEHKADEMRYEKLYVKKVKAALNLYWLQKELKAFEKEEKEIIKRRKEKRFKQKERRAERKRNEQIQMQKEAYVLAMKEIKEN